MFAFRQYDTNSSVDQERLNISPPSKKCAKSPGKVPILSDMLYRADSDSTDSDSGFKFNLQSVTVSSYSEH